MTIYRESDESIRQSFVENVETISPDKLIYVDEMGVERCLYREYARAPIGQKIITKISGRKFKRTNIVAGICQGRWVAPLQYDGTTDSVLFEFWFEQCFLREVGEGMTVILDNATFHRKSILSKLADKHKCKILFLPPYSPDLNPIEKKWAWVKRKLREILHNFDKFDEAVQCVFQVS
jgi:transposase